MKFRICHYSKITSQFSFVRCLCDDGDDDDGDDDDDDDDDDDCRLVDHSVSVCTFFFMHIVQ